MRRLLFLTVPLFLVMARGHTGTLFADEKTTAGPAPQTSVDNPLIVDLQGDRPEEIRKALRQTCTVDIPKQPFNKAVEILAKQWGLNLTIDQIALVEDGVSTEDEVSLTAIEIQRGSALLSLLQQFKVAGYFIDRESVVISTKTVCDDWPDPKCCTRGYESTVWVRSLCCWNGREG